MLVYLALFYSIIFAGLAFSIGAAATRITFPFDPQETQKLAAFAMSPYETVKINGYGGPKFGGKSWTIQYVASMFFLSRPIQIMVIGHKYEDMKALHVEPLKHYLADYIAAGKVRWNETQKSFFCETWGSQIKFQQVSRDSDARDLNGQAWDIVLIDEAQKITPFSLSYLQGICRISHTQSDWRTRLRSEYRRYKAEGNAEMMAKSKKLWDDTLYYPKMLYCFNWGEKGHSWLRRLFWDGCKHAGDPFLRLDKFARRPDGTFKEKPDQYRFIFAPMEKNVRGMKEDPGYRDRIESMEEPYRTAYLTGNPDAFTGLKYEINPLVHEIDFDEYLTVRGYKDERGTFIPEHWSLYGSIDSGVACAAGLFVRTPEGKSFLIDEYYETGRDLPEHQENIDELWRNNRWTRGRMPSITFGDKYAFARHNRRAIDGNEYTFANTMLKKYGIWMYEIVSDRSVAAQAVGAALHYKSDEKGKVLKEPDLFFAKYKTGKKDVLGYDEYVRCGEQTITNIVSLESNPNRPEDVKNDPGIEDHPFDMTKIYLMGSITPPLPPPKEEPKEEKRDYGADAEDFPGIEEAEFEDISSFGSGSIDF